MRRKITAAAFDTLEDLKGRENACSQGNVGDCRKLQ